MAELGETIDLSQGPKTEEKTDHSVPWIAGHKWK